MYFVSKITTNSDIAGI